MFSCHASTLFDFFLNLIVDFRLIIEIIGHGRVHLGRLTDAGTGYRFPPATTPETGNPSRSEPLESGMHSIRAEHLNLDNMGIADRDRHGSIQNHIKLVARLCVFSMFLPPKHFLHGVGASSSSRIHTAPVSNRLAAIATLASISARRRIGMHQAQFRQGGEDFSTCLVVHAIILPQNIGSTTSITAQS